MPLLRLEEANPPGSELADHFDELIRDLSQADRLIGDAVGRLAAGFLHLDKLVRVQRDRTAIVADAAVREPGKPVACLLAGQADIAEQIEREVSAIVVSLQFGDLVSQLLEHSVTRIEMLRNALERKGALPRRGNPCGSGRDEQPDEEPDRARERVSRGKPVIQRDMRAGDFELF